jgi:hypothetical protein
MSFTILQHNSAHASGVVECDVVLAGTNTAHKSLLVIAGWKGAINSPVLTCEDTLGNFYAKSAFTPPLGAGSHSAFNAFHVNNGRPGASPGDCTIKVKSGADVGDFVVAVCEIDGGSGKIVGLPVTVSGGQGLGQTDFSLDSGTMGAGDILLLAMGYGEPNSSTHAATLTGSFPGGSMTTVETHASSVGSVGIFASEFNGTLSGLHEGFDYTLDASPTTSAAAFLMVGIIATSTPSDLDAATPLASPGGGEFSSTPSVALTCALPGMDIHYTLDGSTPTSGSALYSSPIPIPGPLTTLKAIAIDPTGFWGDSVVDTEVYDVFTGTVTNPNNMIDGDDTTFALFSADGGPGDTIAARVHVMAGSTGAAGALKVDFEVTQNDLVAPGQVLKAWKVSAFIGATETVLASGDPGDGVVARAIVSKTLTIGQNTAVIAAKIIACCEIAGSTGGVRVKVYGAYVFLP